jgi:hypothetical protein
MNLKAGQAKLVYPKTEFLEQPLDLFNNPVGYFTSLGKMLRILLFSSGCCLKTEVFKQLY